MKNNFFKNSSKILTYFFILIFIVVPVLFVFVISFLQADSYGNLKIIFTIENFSKLLNPVYMQVLINSVKIASFTTVFTLVIAYPLAVIVSKIKGVWRYIVLMLIVLPYWTNSLVRTYSFLVILRADGIINNLILSLGIVNQPVKLLYTEGAVIASMVYLLMPVMFLPIFSSVSKIDKNLLDAARDAGASSKRVYVDIVLPLTLPGVVAGTVMVFAPSLGMFFVSDLIGGGKVVLLGSVVRDQFSVTRNLPFGSAVSVVMMLLSVIFIFMYYKITFTNENKGNII